MANYSDIRYVATGATEYATADNLPTSGNTTGDQALVTGTNRLYIWNGSGWYNIALINTNPSISGVSSSYNLASDGTATTVTITATDPEGLPITYSIASDTSGNVATVTQGAGANTNVFTITPSTNSANGGTFSLTFRASDGVNIATAPASFVLQFSVVNSKYTTALITSVGANLADNNDFVDSSTNNQTITVAGNVTQTTFSPYRHGGYSTYFDGSGDYITYTDSSLAVGTDDFTIEFWVRREGSQSQNDSPLAQGTTPGWQVCFNTSNNLVFMKDGSARELSTGTLTDLQWYHVVYQRDSGTLQGFLDGVSLGTVSATNDFTNTTIEVGVNRGGTAYFTGNVRDVRVIKGTAFYSSSGFNVPTDPLTTVSGSGYSTILLTCHLPYIADGGANSLSPTVNGNTKTEPFTPYDYTNPYSTSNHGGSLYNDGTGTNYLSVTSNDFQFGTSDDFVIEAWVYPTATPTGAAQIFDNRGAANGLNLAFTGAFASYSEPLASQLTGTTKSLNSWYHVAVVRYNGTRRLFVNGVSEDSIADTGNYNSNSGIIASRWSTDQQAWDGNISDFRIIRGTIPTAYQGTSITVPTAPLAADSYTKLHLQSTNAGIIDKSQSVKAVTLNGDVKSSTTQSKYLTSSMYFDGTGDYISIPVEDGFEFGTGDFTIEMWFWYTGTIARYPIILGNGISGSGIYSGWAVYTAGNVLKLDRYTGSQTTVTFGSFTAAADTWHHLAIARSGTTIRGFINGTQVGSDITNSVSYNAHNTDPLNIGYGVDGAGTHQWNGYMSDVRITKGLARYTANFTPPIAALQG